MGCKFKFLKNNNKLVTLSPDAKNLLLAKMPFRVSVYAVEGMRYGQIYGTDYTYDDKEIRLLVPMDIIMFQLQLCLFRFLFT